MGLLEHEDLYLLRLVKLEHFPSLNWRIYALHIM